MIRQCSGAPWRTAAIQFLSKRRAHGHRTIGAIKPHALARQLINIRCFAICAAINTPGIAAHIVRENENDIGAGFRQRTQRADRNRDHYKNPFKHDYFHLLSLVVFFFTLPYPI